MGTTPKPFQAGQRVTNIRPQLEAMRKQVSPVGSLSAGRNIQLTQTSTGTTISYTSHGSSSLIPGVVDQFLAIVTGNTPEVNRFRYAWKEAEFTRDNIIVKAGRAGTTEVDFAYAIAETLDTAQYQSGIDIMGDDYPANFSKKPIGGGGTGTTHRYDTPVIMWEVYVETFRNWWILPILQPHDGTC